MKTRALHIVLPMAGRGSRFANAGFSTPKPLIKVDGTPMFLKALSSLDKIKADKKYTIIIRKEHVENYNLDKLLKKELPEANIVITNEEPTGAVVDALRSKKYLDEDDAVVVLDCDLYFQSKSYNKTVESALADNDDHSGGLLTFNADHPRYSYAKFGKDKVVTETAEKKVISNHAITGAYFFSHAKHFIHAAEELMKQPVSEKMPEYYLSLLYNILIDEGKKIKAATVDEYSSFGTPEELEAYNASK
jgi:dTDP-glucose pyrophosphorylase